MECASHEVLQFSVGSFRDGEGLMCDGDVIWWEGRYNCLFQGLAKVYLHVSVNWEQTELSGT